MVKYYKRFHFLKVHENWFVYKFKIVDIFTLNVHFHVKNIRRYIFGIKEISYTLELDLEKPEAYITANFSKQIRQQAKIAENEGTICYFHTNLDEFVNFFNDFALKKDTWTTSKKRMEELGENVKMSFAENNGQVLAAHSYLVDADLGIVRHLHSATKRLDENYDRNLIGRANKYLTVNDIFYFKDQGFKTFDFGGFAKDTKDESLKGINNYKLLFGGTIVPCFNYFSVNYWLLKNLIRIMGVSGKVDN